MNRSFRSILVGAAFSAITTVALAQESSDMPSTFPEVCRSSEAAMPPSMHSEAEMGALKEHQRAGMEGMMTMDRDMMQGMMKDDPDVAFVCGMIAHHQGAIDMANVELKHGDNDWAKEMAQKVIDAQTKEIAEMTDWLKDNAK